MTDFRALCEELVDDLEMSDWPYKLKEVFRADIARARAALEAQPEPKTSRLRYCDVHGQQPENAWGCPECVREMRHQLAQPEPQGPTGRPAIEPVPVSERLPGPKDCDKEGCCWWWDYGQDSWSQGMPEYCINRHTHWLPHWALPVPGVEGANA